MDFEETLRWVKSREQKNKIDFYIDRYLIPIVSILIVVVLYVSVYYFVEDEDTKKVKVMRIPRALPQTIKENPLNHSEENQKKIRVVRKDRKDRKDRKNPDATQENHKAEDSSPPVTTTEDEEKDLGETRKSQGTAGTETRMIQRTSEKDRRNPQTITRKSPATKKPFIEEISEQDSPITEQNQEINPQIADGAEKTLISETTLREDSSSPVTATEDVEKDSGENRKIQGTENRANQRTAEKDRRNPQIAERDGAEKTLKISETTPREDSKSPVTATEDGEEDLGETRKSQGTAGTETRKSQGTETRNTPKTPHPEPEEEIVYIDDETGNPVDLEEIDDYEVVDS